MTSVFLCYTVYKNVPAQAFGNALQVVAENIANGMVEGFTTVADLFVMEARNVAVQDAIDLYRQNKISHLWFVDDDMVVPPGALKQLLSRNVDVVGGLYVNTEEKPVAYKITPYELIDSAPTSGMVQVEGIGMGCTLIRCRVLEDLANLPGFLRWFQVEYRDTPRGSYAIGEDVFFCELCARAQILVYLDCDVRCGHVKSKEYRPPDPS